MSDRQKRFFLSEDEIPRQWYNIQADMVNKPLPMIDPRTHQPVKAEDLYQVFCEECVHQELNMTDRWIDIPEKVRDMYKFYRSTPLVRAYGLEEALGTPAHIYFKNESVSPVGSHKLNSAIAQAYYAKQQGIKSVTTETGAGQWGAALSYAASVFGLEAAVYQVKISYNQKPYRRNIMQTFGAQVTPSPSMSTRAGKDIINKNPNCQGSLGTAISEAVELCRTPLFRDEDRPKGVGLLENVTVTNFVFHATSDADMPLLCLETNCRNVTFDGLRRDAALDAAPKRPFARLWKMDDLRYSSDGAVSSLPCGETRELPSPPATLRLGL